MPRGGGGGWAGCQAACSRRPRSDKGAVNPALHAAVEQQVGGVGPGWHRTCSITTGSAQAEWLLRLHCAMSQPPAPANLHLDGVGGGDGHRRRPRPLRHRLPLRVGGLRDGARRALLQHLQALRRREHGGRVLQAHGPQLRRQGVQAGLGRQPALLAAAAVQRGAGGRGRWARRRRRTHRPLLYAGCHDRCHGGCPRLDAVGCRGGRGGAA